MKRSLVVIIVIVILILGGCSLRTKDTSDSQISPTDRPTTTPYISPSTSLTVTPSPTVTPSITPADYSMDYKDETHKLLQIGKLAINFDFHHIVSDNLSDGIETVKCSLDKSESLETKHMTITVQIMEKQEFPTTQSIISYLSTMLPDYEVICIYNQVTDDSDIRGLYCVTGNGLSEYIVYYDEACYLVTSDYDNLETYMFKENHHANYSEFITKVKCANSYITNVKETDYYDQDNFVKAHYEIDQGKDKAKYIVDLSIDDDYVYHFNLKNDTDKSLLTLTTFGEVYDLIDISDVNLDGDADIRFREVGGTMNNSYNLYVYDATTKTYVKVKCKEMLSYFTVHKGYLLNTQKESADSGAFQKLVWVGKHTLKKVSEEDYHLD